MSITFVDEKISDLADKMAGKIRGASPYNTSPQVFDKVTLWEDGNYEQRPCIWFAPAGEDAIRFKDYANADEISAIVRISIWGYADTDDDGNLDEMYNLLHDVLYFIWKDYTERPVSQSCSIYAGGVSNKINESGFKLDVDFYMTVNMSTIKIA